MKYILCLFLNLICVSIFAQTDSAQTGQSNVNSYPWRYPTKKNGSDVIVRVRSNLEIKLPNPEIKFDFSKYKNSKTNLQEAHQMFSDIFKVYYEAYEQELVVKFKLPSDLKLLEPVYFAGVGDISKTPIDKLQDYTLPPKRFKTALDDATVRFFAQSFDYLVSHNDKNKDIVADTKSKEFEDQIEQLILKNNELLQTKFQPVIKSDVRKFFDRYNFEFNLIILILLALNFVLIIRK